MKWLVLSLIFSQQLLSADLHFALNLNSQAQSLFSKELKQLGYSNLMLKLNYDEPHNLGGAEKINDLALISIGLNTFKNLNNENLVFIYCHELGHFLAGNPKKSNGWSSTEVQSDYWSAQVCLPQILELTQLQLTNYLKLQLPSFFKFLVVELRINTDELPFYQLPNPDHSEVKIYSSEYVSFQCRFDIYMAGARSGPYPTCVNHSLHSH